MSSQHPTRVIALTGGIGSGKSVVSQLRRVMGYTVFDCDSSAKRVMQDDPQLRADLTALFGPETYSTTTDGPRLNRTYLASRIFGHPDLIAQMNACVHPAVARDLCSVIGYHSDEPVIFYESAILYESGFDQLAPTHEVWTVSAPLELRISRAMQRDHTTRDKVMSRIASQMPQDEKERRAQAVIINDDRHSIIAQVRSILDQHHF